MCLLVIAWGVSARYPLVVAANRDERHARPALAIHWWHDRPTVFGGRDLAASGSWLAVNRRGRLAAVTNIREQPDGSPVASASRGQLVADFLHGERTAGEFAADLKGQQAGYGPFNLLLFDGDTLAYASNRAAGRLLEPGIHALGNATLDAPWPKLALARTGLTEALALDRPTEALLALLRHPGVEPAAGPEAALFVTGREFGTRSSAVILLDVDGTMSFTERRFGPDGVPAGESHHEFQVAPLGP